MQHVNNYCIDSDDWMKEIELKKMIDAVLLDFSAAFNHKLLDKLNYYGFELCAPTWIRSYLTNRKYTVYSIYFNSRCCEVRAVKCGVPRESCLGTLLFITVDSKMTDYDKNR